MTDAVRAPLRKPHDFQRSEELPFPYCVCSKHEAHGIHHQKKRSGGAPSPRAVRHMPGGQACVLRYDEGEHAPGHEEEDLP